MPARYLCIYSYEEYTQCTELTKKKGENLYKPFIDRHNIKGRKCTRVREFNNGSRYCNCIVRFLELVDELEIRICNNLHVETFSVFVTFFFLSLFWQIYNCLFVRSWRVALIKLNEFGQEVSKECVFRRLRE